MALLAGGCTPAAKTGDAIRFGLAAAPVTLDPRFATDATSARINRLLYARLVDFDPRLRPVPALARWERLTPLHYRFHLDPDRRPFHDGTPLTAADVKATYEFILDPEQGSPHRAALAVVRRIDAPDRDTVDFFLNHPDPLFPGKLVIGILPAARMAAGHPFNTRPLGSGPFAFGAWPEPGRLRLLRLRDRQVVEFVRSKDPTVRLLKLMRGELDLVQNDLPPELVRYAKRQEALRVSFGEGTNFSYLGFNLQDPLLKDRRVRQAIAHAIDRPAIIEHMLGGGARLASALLPPDHWAGVALPACAYDPERARALLREAGWGGRRRPHLVYKTSADPFRIRLATVILQQLSEVGFEAELKSYDWGTFYGDIKAGRFQMYSLAWVGIKTPDIFRYVFHSRSVPPGGANRGRYVSTVADRLIEQAEAAPTLVQQARHYAALQRHLFAELPYVPLWYEDHVVVARADIRGYPIARDGNYDGLIQVRRQ
ncbi:MAG TPA: ABC transporter substrate-binding protein [Gammaproteobacteria bacterium]|nr:ABC transporter substrate-binding protein [Gammaproteobacteria bacterium]